VLLSIEQEYDMGTKKRAETAYRGANDANNTFSLNQS